MRDSENGFNEQSKSLRDIALNRLAALSASYSRVLNFLDAILRERLQGVAK